MRTYLRDPAFWIVGALAIPLFGYGFYALNAVAKRTFPPEDYAVAVLAFIVTGPISFAYYRTNRAWLRTTLSFLEVVLLAVFVVWPFLRYTLGARW